MLLIQDNGDIIWDVVSIYLEFKEESNYGVNFGPKLHIQ